MPKYPGLLRRRRHFFGVQFDQQLDEFYLIVEELYRRGQHLEKHKEYRHFLKHYHKQHLNYPKHNIQPNIIQNNIHGHIDDVEDSLPPPPQRYIPVHPQFLYPDGITPLPTRHIIHNLLNPTIRLYTTALRRFCNPQNDPISYIIAQEAKEEAAWKQKQEEKKKKARLEMMGGDFDPNDPDSPNPAQHNNNAERMDEELNIRKKKKSRGNKYRTYDELNDYWAENDGEGQFHYSYDTQDERVYPYVDYIIEHNYMARYTAHMKAELWTIDLLLQINPKFWTDSDLILIAHMLIEYQKCFPFYVHNQWDSEDIHKGLLTKRRYKWFLSAYNRISKNMVIWLLNLLICKFQRNKAKQYALIPKQAKRQFLLQHQRDNENLLFHSGPSSRKRSTANKNKDNNNNITTYESKIQQQQPTTIPLNSYTQDSILFNDAYNNNNNNNDNNINSIYTPDCPNPNDIFEITPRVLTTHHNHTAIFMATRHFFFTIRSVLLNYICNALTNNFASQRYQQQINLFHLRLIGKEHGTVRRAMLQYMTLLQHQNVSLSDGYHQEKDSLQNLLDQNTGQPIYDKVNNLFSSGRNNTYNNMLTYVHYINNTDINIPPYNPIDKTKKQHKKKLKKLRRLLSLPRPLLSQQQAVLYGRRLRTNRRGIKHRSHQSAYGFHTSEEAQMLMMEENYNNNNNNNHQQQQHRQQHQQQQHFLLTNPSDTNNTNSYNQIDEMHTIPMSNNTFVPSNLEIGASFIYPNYNNTSGQNTGRNSPANGPIIIIPGGLAAPKQPQQHQHQQQYYKQYHMASNSSASSSSASTYSSTSQQHYQHNSRQNRHHKNNNNIHNHHDNNTTTDVISKDYNFAKSLHDPTNITIDIEKFFADSTASDRVIRDGIYNRYIFSHSPAARANGGIRHAGHGSVRMQPIDFTHVDDLRSVYVRMILQKAIHVVLRNTAPPQGFTFPPFMSQQSTQQQHDDELMSFEYPGGLAGGFNNNNSGGGGSSINGGNIPFNTNNNMNNVDGEQQQRDFQAFYKSFKQREQKIQAASKQQQQQPLDNNHNTNNNIFSKSGFKSKKQLDYENGLKSPFLLNPNESNNNIQKNDQYFLDNSDDTASAGTTPVFVSFKPHDDNNNNMKHKNIGVSNEIYNIKYSSGNVPYHILQQQDKNNKRILLGNLNNNGQEVILDQPPILNLNNTTTNNNNNNNNDDDNVNDKKNSVTFANDVGIYGGKSPITLLSLHAPQNNNNINNDNNNLVTLTGATPTSPTRYSPTDSASDHITPVLQRFSTTAIATGAASPQQQTNKNKKDKNKRGIHNNNINNNKNQEDQDNNNNNNNNHHHTIINKSNTLAELSLETTGGGIIKPQHHEIQGIVKSSQPFSPLARLHQRNLERKRHNNMINNLNNSTNLTNTLNNTHNNHHNSSNTLINLQHGPHGVDRFAQQYVLHGTLQQSTEDDDQNNNNNNDTDNEYTIANDNNDDVTSTSSYSALAHDPTMMSLSSDHQSNNTHNHNNNNHETTSTSSTQHLSIPQTTFTLHTVTRTPLFAQIFTESFQQNISIFGQSKEILWFDTLFETSLYDLSFVYYCLQRLLRLITQREILQRRFQRDVIMIEKYWDNRIAKLDLHQQSFELKFDSKLPSHNNNNNRYNNNSTNDITSTTSSSFLQHKKNVTVAHFERLRASLIAQRTIALSVLQNEQAGAMQIKTQQLMILERHFMRQTKQTLSFLDLLLRHWVHIHALQQSNVFYYGTGNSNNNINNCTDCQQLNKKRNKRNQNATIKKCTYHQTHHSAGCGGGIDIPTRQSRLHLLFTALLYITRIAAYYYNYNRLWQPTVIEVLQRKQREYEEQQRDVLEEELNRLLMSGYTTQHPEYISIQQQFHDLKAQHAEVDYIKEREMFESTLTPNQLQNYKVQQHFQILSILEPEKTNVTVPRWDPSNHTELAPGVSLRLLSSNSNYHTTFTAQSDLNDFSSFINVVEENKYKLQQLREEQERKQYHQQQHHNGKHINSNILHINKYDIDVANHNNNNNHSKHYQQHTHFELNNNNNSTDFNIPNLSLNNTHNSSNGIPPPSTTGGGGESTIGELTLFADPHTNNNNNNNDNGLASLQLSTLNNNNKGNTNNNNNNNSSSRGISTYPGLSSLQLDTTPVPGFFSQQQQQQQSIRPFGNLKFPNSNTPFQPQPQQLHQQPQQQIPQGLSGLMSPISPTLQQHAILGRLNGTNINNLNHLTHLNTSANSSTNPSSHNPNNSLLASPYKTKFDNDYGIFPTSPRQFVHRTKRMNKERLKKIIINLQKNGLFHGLIGCVQSSDDDDELDASYRGVMTTTQQQQQQHSGFRPYNPNTKAKFVPPAPSPRPPGHDLEFMRVFNKQRPHHQLYQQQLNEEREAAKTKQEKEANNYNQNNNHNNTNKQSTHNNNNNTNNNNDTCIATTTHHRRGNSYGGYKFGGGGVNDNDDILSHFTHTTLATTYEDGPSQNLNNNNNNNGGLLGIARIPLQHTNTNMTGSTDVTPLNNNNSNNHSLDQNEQHNISGPSAMIKHNSTESQEQQQNGTTKQQQQQHTPPSRLPQHIRQNTTYSEMATTVDDSFSSSYLTSSSQHYDHHRPTPKSPTEQRLLRSAIQDAWHREEVKQYILPILPTSPRAQRLAMKLRLDLHEELKDIVGTHNYLCENCKLILTNQPDVVLTSPKPITINHNTSGNRSQAVVAGYNQQVKSPIAVPNIHELTQLCEICQAVANNTKIIPTPPKHLTLYNLQEEEEEDGFDMSGVGDCIGFGENSNRHVLFNNNNNKDNNNKSVHIFGSSNNNNNNGKGNCPDTLDTPVLSLQRSLPAAKTPTAEIHPRFELFKALMNNTNNVNTNTGITTGIIAGSSNSGTGGGGGLLDMSINTNTINNNNNNHIATNFLEDAKENDVIDTNHGNGDGNDAQMVENYQLLIMGGAPQHNSNSGPTRQFSNARPTSSSMQHDEMRVLGSSGGLDFTMMDNHNVNHNVSMGRNNHNILMMSNNSNNNNNNSSSGKPQGLSPFMGSSSNQQQQQLSTTGGSKQHKMFNPTSTNAAVGGIFDLRINSNSNNNNKTANGLFQLNTSANNNNNQHANQQQQQLIEDTISTTSTSSTTSFVKNLTRQPQPFELPPYYTQKLQKEYQQQQEQQQMGDKSQFISPGIQQTTTNNMYNNNNINGNGNNTNINYGEDNIDEIHTDCEDEEEQFYRAIDLDMLLENNKQSIRTTWASQIGSLRAKLQELSQVIGSQSNSNNNNLNNNNSSSTNHQFSPNGIPLQTTTENTNTNLTPAQQEQLRVLQRLTALQDPNTVEQAQLIGGYSVATATQKEKRRIRAEYTMEMLTYIQKELFVLISLYTCDCNCTTKDPHYQKYGNNKDNKEIYDMNGALLPDIVNLTESNNNPSNNNQNIGGNRPPSCNNNNNNNTHYTNSSGNHSPLINANVGNNDRYHNNNNQQLHYSSASPPKSLCWTKLTHAVLAQQYKQYEIDEPAALERKGRSLYNNFTRQGDLVEIYRFIKHLENHHAQYIPKMPSVVATTSAVTANTLGLSTMATGGGGGGGLLLNNSHGINGNNLNISSNTTSGKTIGITTMTANNHSTPTNRDKSKGLMSSSTMIQHRSVDNNINNIDIRPLNVSNNNNTITTKYHQDPIMPAPYLGVIPSHNQDGDNEECLNDNNKIKQIKFNNHRGSTLTTKHQQQQATGGVESTATKKEKRSSRSPSRDKAHVLPISKLDVTTTTTSPRKDDKKTKKKTNNESSTYVTTDEDNSSCYSTDDDDDDNDDDYSTTSDYSSSGSYSSYTSRSSSSDRRHHRRHHHHRTKKDDDKKNKTKDKKTSSKDDKKAKKTEGKGLMGFFSKIFGSGGGNSSKNTDSKKTDKEKEKKKNKDKKDKEQKKRIKEKDDDYYHDHDKKYTKKDKVDKYATKKDYKTTDAKKSKK